MVQMAGGATNVYATHFFFEASLWSIPTPDFPEVEGLFRDWPDAPGTGPGLVRMSRNGGPLESEKRAGSVHNALFGADHRINVVSASVVAGLPDHFIIWPIGNGAVAQVLCQACLEFSLCKVSWAIRNYRRLVRGRRGRPATIENRFARYTAYVLWPSAPVLL